MPHPQLLRETANISVKQLYSQFSLCLSVCKAYRPKKSSTYLTLPFYWPCPIEGGCIMAQGVVAIFHFHLQFYLNVIQAKPAKLKKYIYKKESKNRVRKISNQNLTQRGFHCLFVFEYLKITCQFTIINTKVLPKFLQYILFF